MNLNCFGVSLNDDDVWPYFQPGTLSDVQTFANLWRNLSRFWACAEPEFNLSSVFDNKGYLPFVNRSQWTGTFSYNVFLSPSDTCKLWNDMSWMIDHEWLTCHEWMIISKKERVRIINTLLKVKFLSMATPLPASLTRNLPYTLFSRNSYEVY